jgi:hypothetical protein
LPKEEVSNLGRNRMEMSWMRICDTVADFDPRLITTNNYHGYDHEDFTCANVHPSNSRKYQVSPSSKPCTYDGMYTDVGNTAPS